MKKFLVLYHAPKSALKQMEKSTPEQAKAGMNAWMKWSNDCGSAIVELGAPLGNGKSVTPDAVTESRKDVAGFSIMQGKTMETIIKRLKKHPHFMMSGKCTIEVHEELPMDGM